MSISTKTIIFAAAALAISSLAAASNVAPEYRIGVENRSGLVGIPVCAKADKEAGTKYIYTDDLYLREALIKAASGVCFERLGPGGDKGYVSTSVSLIAVGDNIYKSIVYGRPAGPAIRALTVPKAEVGKSNEVQSDGRATMRAGVVTMSMYSGTGHMTLNVVSFRDGSRAIVRRTGDSPRLPVGATVMVEYEKLDDYNYWVSIPGQVL